MIVDYFSKYIEISLLPNKTAKTVIRLTKSIFSHHGIPQEMISDNIPYNSKEFRDFARDWGFKVTTSSPTYPQSNGLSEKTVQIVKRILKKTCDPYIGVLEYRNTPVTGMSYSPSQLLMSRITRSKLPVSNSLLHTKLATGVVKELTHCQQRQKHYYDMAAKPLSPLKENNSVRIRQNNTWVPAQVTHPVTTPRSYIVPTPSGKEYRHNRQHLLKTKATADFATTLAPNVDDDNQVEVQQAVDEPESSPSTQLRRSTRVRILPTKYNDYVMT